MMRQRYSSVLSLTLASAVACVLFGASLAGGARAAGHLGHGSQSDISGLPGDLLLFPDLTVIGRYDQGPTKRLADSDVIPAINVFYTANYERFRFLGEWLVSTKTHNLERFQLGWQLGESSLWLGRFHNPIGFWNMQFHHGAFLQTTISRPGIMAFETQGGIIPNHLTGFLWEGIHEFGESGLYYTIGAGAGPQINRGLEAFNLVEPGGTRRPGVSFRLGYQPVSYGVDEFGISGAYTQIHSDDPLFSQAKQFVATAYANTQLDNVRLLGEVIYVNNRVDRPQGGTANGDFVNAYGQLEVDLKQDWTVFGRVEGTLGAANDPYLAVFPKYVKDRFMGGMRYKVNHNMALKLELSQEHLRDDRYGQVMFQWSAVFP